jgi:hypothetical protein
MAGRAPPLGRELLHPLPLGAVALLLLNDHVLKQAGLLPGWLTGKLSDVAGLFFFPILLFVAVDAMSGRRASAGSWRPRSARIVTLVTVIVFSAVKLWQPANAWMQALWGATRLDASDLVALPFAVLGGWWIVRRPRAQAAESRWLRFAAFVAAALASIATPAPQQTRNYPAWRVEWLGARQLGCAQVDLWVNKSGKQGFGLALELRPVSGECQVEVRSARFEAPGTLAHGERLPTSLRLDRKRHLYVAFPFDNEALWNASQHAGTLELVLVVNGTSERLSLAMRHAWQGPHRTSRPPEPATSASPPPFAQPPPGEAFELEPSPR